MLLVDGVILRSRRGRYLYVMAAVLVAVFVALYPYLDVAGYCDDGGCPEITQISASSSPDLPTAGVLVSLVGACVAMMLVAGSLRSGSERPPNEVLLSPESPPPRL